MFRFFLILLSLTIALNALSNAQILKRANGFIKSDIKSNQFRAYNDYKNLYLKSLMNGDKKLRIKALVGITRSGKKLHIDISQYEEELSKRSVQPAYKVPKSKTIKKVHLSKKLKVKSSHKLQSVKWENDRLVLKFDKTLLNNQINYFTLYDSKKKTHKYVFDIRASTLIRSQGLRKDGVDKIRLAQFNPSTLRLVIENRSKVKIEFKKSASKLVILITPHRSSKNKIIVIDPGHGGKDPGAVGYRKYREKIVVLDIAKKLKKILNSRGYRVYMTRSTDKFVKLRNRTNFANKKEADIFISIHANAVAKKNAHKVQGIECFFLSKSRSKRAKKAAEKENMADLSEMNFYGKETFLNTVNSHNIVASNKLAIDLQRSSLATLGKSYKNVHGAGVREGPFWVLVGAQMPSVLVEVGFITHPKEARRLVNVKYQNKFALGLANGVERYFLHN